MSKNIKSENVKFKVSHVAYALIAAVAASATLTVHANTTRNWIGGTGTADAAMNLWDYANWNGEGNFGTGNTVDCLLSVTDTTYLNSASGNRICCDLLPNSGDFVFTGPLQFYSFKPGSVENSTVSVLKKSGDWTVATYGMYIGNASGTKATFVNESGNVTVNYIDFGTFAQGGGRGTLTIKGGMVTVNTSTRFYGGEGTINLDGGTLVTKRIQRYGQNGSLIQNINFNGGTLKASASDATPFIQS